MEHENICTTVKELDGYTEHIKSHLPGLCYCWDEGKQMLDCKATFQMIKSRITIKQT
jgi:hypothetical protein